MVAALVNGTSMTEHGLPASQVAMNGVMAALFLLLAALSTVQVTCGPGSASLSENTIRNRLFGDVLLAGICRGLYFILRNLLPETSPVLQALSSLFYPLLLSLHALIAAFWAECYHLPKGLPKPTHCFSAFFGLTNATAGYAIAGYHAVCVLARLPRLLRSCRLRLQMIYALNLGKIAFVTVTGADEGSGVAVALDRCVIERRSPPSPLTRSHREAQLPPPLLPCVDRRDVDLCV